MRSKNRNNTKLNKILRDSEIKKIEKDPNAYDAILWPSITVEATAPAAESHYEEDAPLVLDEVENETDLGEPELIVMVDMPSSVSYLTLSTDDSDITGGANEPIAVKINKRNVPEGSAIMFNVMNSKRKSISVFYSVHKVRATDNQGLNHIYYLLPFTGDSDELPAIS